MLQKIRFKNYKLFKSQQTLELKPITIVIGKNSSGKTALLKLMLLVENLLEGKDMELLKFLGGKIELGGAFNDLLYARRSVGTLELELEEKNNTLKLAIGADMLNNANPEFYSCEYNGNHINIEEGTKSINKLIETKTLSFSLKTEYISSRRKEPLRYWDKPAKMPETVGFEGEEVYNILLMDGISRERNLLQEVSKFYQDSFEGWGIGINEDKSPAYEIELLNKQLKINIKDVGLGMIHVLPLATKALMPQMDESLIIIEEPEQHLHPAAHGNLASLFAASVYQKKSDFSIDKPSYSGKHYLIETHSQNFILRLRRLVAEDKLNPQDLVIYYIDFDEDTSESKLIRINIDSYGRPRNEQDEVFWPEHIFSETLQETIAIRTAQENKQ